MTENQPPNSPANLTTFGGREPETPVGDSEEKNILARKPNRNEVFFGIFLVAAIIGGIFIFGKYLFGPMVLDRFPSKPTSNRGQTLDSGIAAGNGSDRQPEAFGPERQNNTIPLSWEIYKNDEYNYEIGHPGEWYIFAQDQYGAIMRDNPTDINREYDSRLALDVFLISIEEAVGDYYDISSPFVREIEIAGRRSYLIPIPGLEESTTGQMAFIEKGAEVTIVLEFASFSNNSEAVFNQVLSTFSFIE